MEESEQRDLKTEILKWDIDTIIANKMKKLNGYGVHRAVASLGRLYALKKSKAPNIEIFDEMAEISRILKEYTSKTKGKQQQLLGLKRRKK